MKISKLFIGLFLVLTMLSSVIGEAQISDSNVLAIEPEGVWTPANFLTKLFNYIFVPQAIVTSGADKPSNFGSCDDYEGKFIFSKIYSTEEVVIVGGFCSDNARVVIGKCLNDACTSVINDIAEGYKVIGVRPEFTDWSGFQTYFYKCYACDVDEVPCLVGFGPLLPGQEFCEEDICQPTEDGENRICDGNKVDAWNFDACRYDFQFDCSDQGKTCSDGECEEPPEDDDSFNCYIPKASSCDIKIVGNSLDCMGLGGFPSLSECNSNLGITECEPGDISLCFSENEIKICDSDGFWEDCQEGSENPCDDNYLGPRDCFDSFNDGICDKTNCWNPDSKGELFDPDCEVLDCISVTNGICDASQDLKELDPDCKKGELGAQCKKDEDCEDELFCKGYEPGILGLFEVNGICSEQENGEDDDEEECSLLLSPVCGTDGNTYTNSCFAEKAGITFTLGECEEPGDNTLIIVGIVLLLAFLFGTKQGKKLIFR